jgi:hypothetical protein
MQSQPADGHFRLPAIGGISACPAGSSQLKVTPAPASEKGGDCRLRKRARGERYRTAAAGPGLGRAGVTALRSGISGASRMSAISGVAAFDASCEIHAGHLTQQHRLILPIRHDRVPQVVEPAVHADISDQIFAALLIDESAAGIDAEARDRGFVWTGVTRDTRPAADIDEFRRFYSALVFCTVQVVAMLPTGTGDSTDVPFMNQIDVSPPVSRQTRSALPSPLKSPAGPPTSWSGCCRGCRGPGPMRRSAAAVLAPG